MRLIWVGLALIAPLALAASVCRAAEGNLVFNGDFETASEASPPPGWAMWGPEESKVPANYTRDTTDPHSGDACLRIHHPADSEGFLVTSPDHAIRPRAGMMYTLSFWARSDKPGPAVFTVCAYESIAPYVDAQSPGEWSIDVGPTWQRYDFTVREGWDFFADRSRYLLPGFSATGDRSLERTLWIDDVVATEQPTDRPGRMIDTASLPYEPLRHPLRPGETLDFTVDATDRVRPACRQAGGISFNLLAGSTSQPFDRQGKYILAPQLEQAIRDLPLPMTRFYGVAGGRLGVEGALDRAAEVADRVGVPQGQVVLELENVAATATLAPEVWAQAAAYSVSKGYGFREWEVANEPYWTKPDSAYPTGDAYAAHVRAVAEAVRAVQPDAQIGIAINPDKPSWYGALLSEAAGSYDFVVAHYYAFVNVQQCSFEDATLTANYRILDRALRANAVIRACNPQRPVYQLDTEWGLFSSGPNGEEADYVNRNANIWGTIHRAIRLIYYAREGMLRGASSWDLLSEVRAPGFGVLSAGRTREALHALLALLLLQPPSGRERARHRRNRSVAHPAAGASAPQTSGGDFAGPVTPVIATLSADGRHLYLVAANGSWDRTVPCRATLRGFQAASAETVLLSNNDPDASPILERKEDLVGQLPVQLSQGELTCTLPPHSAAFITLTAR